MPLKIICIGDLHIKISNMSRAKEMTSRIIETVKDIKPDFVVVMGDTLDRFNDVKTEALTLAIDFLSELHKISKVFLLIGNHDLPNN